MKPAYDEYPAKERPLSDYRGVQVFLAVHGVEREDAVAQAHRADQRLHSADLVRFLVDHFMREKKLCPNVFPSMATKRNGAAAQETSRLSA